MPIHIEKWEDVDNKAFACVFFIQKGFTAF